ncbi:phenylacetate--CoA ligase family protein [Amycolatopsis sp. CA-230715]|uniref:phenylacetate--CoA ligase family protein n=1 Tax=Amycolatopsis sp. CA-230715 TaxID=2745196 RepID=UPI001C014F5B|nr:phenylacetate--CoA ligase family protein [Amycolatopsis sp. CA-230715]QWF84667.1 Phenylacetate-coenzyme A ligase [Amycolatopsis sp. CA-230715]
MNRELTELVDFARANSPFYKGLYDGLTGPYRITDLPIIDQPAFWAANTVHGNRVLTGPQRDGIVFKTGGTTSAPRVSVYTREEWREMAATFATGLTAAGVRPGDRVANLYHAGELYSGFVFTLNVLQQALVDTVQLPVAGNAPLEFTVQTLRDFDATVLAGFPTYLVGLAKFVRDTVGSLPGVRLILFSGEAFYGDQRACVEAAFPHASIRSIGYASVDGGILGAPVADDSDVRVFRAFQPSRVLEIVDTVDASPIEEPGRPGRLLLTDLGRRLLPIIRYPVGDLAEWTDFPSRTFRLLGRADEGARIGHVTLHLDHLRAVVDSATTGELVEGFQVVLRRHEAKDQLVLRVACEPADRARATAAISAGVDEISPRFAGQVRDGIVQPLAVAWVSGAEIRTNPRTGKAMRLVDERPV